MNKAQTATTSMLLAAAALMGSAPRLRAQEVVVEERPLTRQEIRLQDKVQRLAAKEFLQLKTAHPEAKPDVDKPPEVVLFPAKIAGTNEPYKDAAYVAAENRIYMTIAEARSTRSVKGILYHEDSHKLGTDEPTADKWAAEARGPKTFIRDLEDQRDSLSDKADYVESKQGQLHGGGIRDRERQVAKEFGVTLPQDAANIPVPDRPKKRKTKPQNEAALNRRKDPEPS